MLSDKELQEIFDKLVADKYEKIFQIALIEGDRLTMLEISADKKGKYRTEGLSLDLRVYLKDDKGSHYIFNSRWNRTPVEEFGRSLYLSLNEHISGLYIVETREHWGKLDVIVKKLDTMLDNPDVIITYDDWSK